MKFTIVPVYGSVCQNYYDTQTHIAVIAVSDKFHWQLRQTTAALTDTICPQFWTSALVCECGTSVTLYWFMASCWFVVYILQRMSNWKLRYAGTTEDYSPNWLGVCSASQQQHVVHCGIDLTWISIRRDDRPQRILEVLGPLSHGAQGLPIPIWHRNDLVSKHTQVSSLEQSRQPRSVHHLLAGPFQKVHRTCPRQCKLGRRPKPQASQTSCACMLLMSQIRWKYTRISWRYRNQRSWHKQAEGYAA
jgi:hypothetical protein